MDIALLGAGIGAVETGRARDIADARRQGLEDRIQSVDHVLVAANHQAVATLQPPDPAGGPHVDIGLPLGLQRRRAADVVLVEAVAAVDHGVPGLHELAQRRDRVVGGPAGRQHHPRRPWRLQLAHEIGKVVGGRAAVPGQGLDRLGVPVIDHALMARPHQPARDVAAHPAKPDHTQLHPASLCQSRSFSPASVPPPRRSAAGPHRRRVPDPDAGYAGRAAP